MPTTVAWAQFAAYSTTGRKPEGQGHARDRRAKKRPDVALPGPRVSCLQTQRGPELMTLLATAMDKGPIAKFRNSAPMTEADTKELPTKGGVSAAATEDDAWNPQASHSAREVSKGPGAPGLEPWHQGKPRARNSPCRWTGFLLLR